MQCAVTGARPKLRAVNCAPACAPLCQQARWGSERREIFKSKSPEHMFPDWMVSQDCLKKGQWPPPQQGNGRAARCRCAWHSSCRLCATLQGGGLQEHCRPPSKLQPPSEATPKAGPRKVGCSRDQAYSAAASGLLLLLQAAPATAAPRCCGFTALLHSAACEGAQPCTAAPASSGSLQPVSDSAAPGKRCSHHQGASTPPQLQLFGKLFWLFNSSTFRKFIYFI